MTPLGFVSHCSLLFPCIDIQIIVKVLIFDTFFDIN